MNTIYFTKGIAAKLFAVVALFSLIASMLPMQAFAASGSVWTTTGSCGAPQNVNQYQVGQTVYINGSGFTANSQLTWTI